MSDGGEHGVVPVAGIAGGHQSVRPVAGHGEHRTDLDGGVDGLHGRGVRLDLPGVLVRRPVGVEVVLPTVAVDAVAVDLVADLPVLRPVALGDVGVANPVRGLLGRAGAVVGDQDRLGAGRPDRSHEGVEAGTRGDVTAGCGVVDPVVDVGVGAARVAQRADSGGLVQGGHLGVVHVRVPDGGVGAERGGADGAQARARVDRDRGVAGGGRVGRDGGGGQRQCGGHHGEGGRGRHGEGATEPVWSPAKQHRGVPPGWNAGPGPRRGAGRRTGNCAAVRRCGASTVDDACDGWGLGSAPMMGGGAGHVNLPDTVGPRLCAGRLETSVAGRQQSKTDQQISLRMRWSSRTSSRIASGSCSRCQRHSSRPALSASPAGAAARTALIA